MTEHILAHQEAGVLTLTFNRVEKKNALTRDMYVKLSESLEQGAEDDAVRVVVLQGAVEVFTAGNDLVDFLTNPPDADKGTEEPVFRFLQALYAFPKPVIAAVCGPAVGVGTTMLLHCDLVYAGDNAAFSMPFVNLGVCPEAGSSLLLQNLVGYHRAAEKLMLGEAFYAEEAVEMGLANRILPPHEVNGYAQVQAAKLAAKPASSLRITKALMKKHHPTVPAVMMEEGRQFSELIRGPAAKEAMSAIMEKRRPDFSKC